MEIVFETPNIRFTALLNSGPAAEKIARIFPLDAAILRGERSISVVLPVQALAAPVVRAVAAGDITYSYTEKRMFVFFESFDFSGMPSFMVYLGKTSCSPHEVASIHNQEQVHVSALESAHTPSSQERVLSQSEIDALLKNLKK